MKTLFRAALIGIIIALLSQSMLSTTNSQSTSVINTTDTISGNPLWYGIGSDWRIYQSTPQNPGGTRLNLTELLQGWQDDITNYQKNYAFNTIRLACSFADSGENLTESVLNMTELDDVLQLFASYNIKVILDLHNYDDPVRNVTDMPGFFGSSKWIADWMNVASRYKESTEILAYEIYNEPSYAFGNWDPSVTGGGCGIPYNGTGKSVTMALAECVDAIRSVGDNHPIIYPDPHYFTVANNENDPEQFFESADNRQNIVITFHDWFQDEPQSVFEASWNNSINLQKSWESYYPIWIGEFGMFDNSSFQTEVNSEIIKWAVDNLVGFSMFIARSNPAAREEQWNMSENALADFTPPVLTPPTTEIYVTGTQGLNEWYISNVTVALAATDNQTEISLTQYSFDGTTWTDYIGPFAISNEGITTLYYNSTDDFGNTELTKNQTIKIDTSYPTLTEELTGTVGANGWYTSDVTVTLISSDGLPGSGVASTEYSFDGSTWSFYTQPFVISTEGSTTLYHRVTDNAGLLYVLPSEAIKIDKTNPITTCDLSGTLGSDGWYVSDVRIALTATESSSGVASTVYSFDGTNWNVYTGPFTISNEGVTTVYYYSTNMAGDTEKTQQVTVRIAYVVAFIEAGLSSGTQWSVTLGAITQSSTSNTVKFRASLGNYTWSIGASIFGGIGIRYAASQPSGSINIPAQIVQSITFEKQYYLTMIVNFGTTSPSSGWYDTNSNVTMKATSPSTSAGERYEWLGWKGTGVGSYTGMNNPAINSVTIQGPISESDSWSHQYMLTVKTNGVHSPYSAQVFIGRIRVGSASDASPFITWFVASSLTGTIGVDSQVSYSSNARYTFTFWSDGPTANPRQSTVMTAPKVFTANYKTQFRVTFSQSGIQSNYRGVIVTIDSANYAWSGLPISFWWDSGITQTFRFLSPLTMANRKYMWSFTTGLSTVQSGTITILSAGVIIGKYIRN